VPDLDPAIVELIHAPSFGVLTSLNGSGQPHSTVMWVDEDREHLLINTRTTRRHYANLMRVPSCTVVIVDPSSFYHYAVVRATLADTICGDRAADHVHMLSHRYRGVPYHTAAPHDRIILRLSPTAQREAWSHRGRTRSST
jgi:PPOX class probable F420-dependent enzyme